MYIVSMLAPRFKEHGHFSEPGCKDKESVFAVCLELLFIEAKSIV